MTIPKTVASVTLHLSMLFIICTAAFAQTKRPAEPSATITIHVMDEWGNTIDGCRVERFFDRGHEMTSHFHDLTGKEIPYGVYQYALNRPGAVSREDLIQGVVAVWVPEKLIVVSTRRVFMPGLSVDPTIPPGFVIQGRLEPLPKTSKEETFWIRLSPIHGTEQLDASVDSTGRFRIYWPLVGRYVLTVIRGADVLQVQEASFEATARPGELIVKMPQQPPSILRIQDRN